MYLDNAAATEIDPRVLETMMPFLTTYFVNPSPLYAAAVASRSAIDRARQTITEVLSTTADTILFTSGGTESTNMAILGLARSYTSAMTHKKAPHIITTKIEHHAVLHPIRQLEKEGFAVTYLSVNSDGQISVDEFKKTLRPETVLVSIMYTNNEIGTVLPIADIGREILRWRKEQGTVFPYFHTDACQAAAYLDLTVEKLHVDLLSANGSKIYGPKGSGILYKRRGVPLQPLMYGGGQEYGLRSGTENVLAIVGLGSAFAQIRKSGDKEYKKIAKLRNYFWQHIQKKIRGVILNGPNLDLERGTRLPNNLNIMFHGVDAEAIILYLDAAGIACSSGSACTTDSDDVSHVLLAIGRTVSQAKSSIRFTLGKYTTKKDIDYVVKSLGEIIRKLEKSLNESRG